MKYESPTAASPCVHQQLRRCRWESCVFAVPSERGDATCPGCSSVRARLTVEVGEQCTCSARQRTHRSTSTHTHIAEVSMACGKCLCVTGCRGNIFCVRFMHCAKVGRVKGLQFECCRDPFSRRVGTQRKKPQPDLNFNIETGRG